jgi:hypothetical protein
VHLPPAAFGYPAQILDVDVYQRAGMGVRLAADHSSGLTVQSIQPVQTVADQDTMHSRAGLVDVARDAVRSHFRVRRRYTTLASTVVEIRLRRIGAHERSATPPLRTRATGATTSTRVAQTPPSPPPHAQSEHPLRCVGTTAIDQQELDERYRATRRPPEVVRLRPLHTYYRRSSRW